MFKVIVAAVAETVFHTVAICAGIVVICLVVGAVFGESANWLAALLVAAWYVWYRYRFSV